MKQSAHLPDVALSPSVLIVDDYVRLCRMPKQGFLYNQNWPLGEYWHRPLTPGGLADLFQHLENMAGFNAPLYTVQQGLVHCYSCTLQWP